MKPTPGFCGCGCGGRTKIAPRTHAARGWVKGQPQFYLRGHAAWKDHGPRWIEGPIPVDRPGLGPCWIWQRSLSEAGYAMGGFAKDGGRPSQLAGRALWEQHIGPIPDGYELDHLCYTPACVRWTVGASPGGPHLEPVTPEENRRRRRTDNQKLFNPHLAEALELREEGLSWRAIASELGCTHPPLLNRLYKYCEVNSIPFPKSESTRPAHLKPAKRPPARECLSCIGFCRWTGEIWICGRCDAQFDMTHGAKFAAPQAVAS